MQITRSKKSVEVNNHHLVKHDTLGINIEKPKFPQYAVRSIRADSYKSWPEYLPLKPDVLIEAGLVYTGVGDSVRCYHCGGGLRNWDEGDVPFEEHAKWYPTCPHVLLVKGQIYVDALLSGEKPDDGAKSETKVTTCVDLLNTPAAQSCIQNNFPEASIRKAIEKFRSNYSHVNFTGTQLCELLFEMEALEDTVEEPSAKLQDSNINVADTAIDNVADSKTSIEETASSTTENVGSDLESLDTDDFDRLLSENERLKQNQMCKICLDDVANVIFLPCGHMVCCPQCAPALNKCPICRNCVKGHVKAYFGILEDKT